MNKKRVLLTESYGPCELGWGEDQFDLFASRLARGHGAFRVSSHFHSFGLYMIAENISHPTTVLEHPHWDEFDRELDENYDILGIQLNSVNTTKIARMVKRAREKCPNTEIVVGGYGVCGLDARVPGDKNGDAAYIRENADYLCQEEGVRFMRRLLEDEPVDREVTQYWMPMACISPMGLDPYFRMRIPIILVSLGCPNGCDFCCTSAAFNHEKIYVAEPEQVYRFMKHYQKRLKKDDIVVLLYDEDLFQDADYVRELGRLIRSDKKTWGIKYYCLGSLKSVSQFDPVELRDCGVMTVWIGVESFQCGTNLTDDRYGKRKGKEIKEMFANLHQHGIDTVGSLVLGFDFHDRENLKKDIDQFVALKPTTYQISPLRPCPGTELYNRLMEQGNILETYRWEDLAYCGDDAVDHKNFKRGELKEFYDYAHQQIRDLLGPPELQSLENNLNGYKFLKGRNSEYYAFQAAQARKMSSDLAAYLRACKLHHGSPAVRKRAEMLEKRFHDEIGPTPLLTSILSRYLCRNIKKNLKKQSYPRVSDPPPRWTYYNTFDDRVWVRKGRKRNKPVPYRTVRSLPHVLIRSLQ